VAEKLVDDEAEESSGEETEEEESGKEAERDGDVEMAEAK